MARSETCSTTKYDDTKFVGMEGSSNDPEEVGSVEGYSRVERRKIIRKIDFRIVFPLGLMMAASFLDRANMGNAAISGMSKDLDLSKGERYSLILLVFFITYVIFQMPATIVVRKFGPRIFLPTITLLWGIVMMCFGFVQDWRVMVALRLLLGAFEAGLFPGAVYTISQWYTRADIQTRYSSFYTISLLGAAFSGLLACAFSQMKGIEGLNAWRWILIMEGLLTCAISFIGFTLLVNMPADGQDAWRFLTEREAHIVIESIGHQRNDSYEDDSFEFRKFLRPALDINIWGFELSYLCMSTVIYAISFFMPIILQGQLGFSLIESQALNTPPYIFACLQMCFQAWLGGKTKLRGLIIIYNGFQAAVGICVLAWVKSPWVQYFGIFLIAGGTQSNLPAIITWQTNNIRGKWKQTFCSASIIGAGGVGGIAGSLIFRSQDAPLYMPGFYACLVCCALTIGISVAMMIRFHKANNRAARGEIIIEGLDGFHYML
ncbi:hypothetical protein N7509_001294 [Penicillium cosmopolitanum]|uniref:Major facilitator superfamily (MFS) profile domain-containing protein n=1 Tax=Penicillium cosmopolitanum TaxID=1131564 RepID=A0A9W9WC75_9EURO|nr:uncharacterized protein N7509_001294 [Penicillium cosmopolitanum]KAJ5414667.1 hypothetical protein N7509_001294 [Penicillium cosmopolitanum]